MLAKVIKFVRQHLAAVVGIAAIVLTLLLMLLPGQFADLKTVSIAYNKLNGYEFLFNFKRIEGEVVHPGYYCINNALPDKAKALPAAIAIIVLFVVAIASLVLYKKSSALFLLGGVAEVVSSIFFFAMEASVNKFYDSKVSTTIYGEAKFEPVILWVSYLAGALLLLAGAYVIYKAILVMKDEVKHPQAQAGGPTYNYLKK